VLAALAALAQNLKFHMQAEGLEQAVAQPSWLNIQ
jgi:hypothetical protein